MMVRVAVYVHVVLYSLLLFIIVNFFYCYFQLLRSFFIFGRHHHQRLVGNTTCTYYIPSATFLKSAFSSWAKWWRFQSKTHILLDLRRHFLRFHHVYYTPGEQFKAGFTLNWLLLVKIDAQNARVQSSLRTHTHITFTVVDRSKTSKSD